MAVNPDVEAALKSFHEAKKWMGFVCIAPIIAAKVFGNAKLTLGSDNASGPAGVAQSFGNDMQETSIDEVCVDETNRIVSAQAYIKGDATSFQVYNNIEILVKTIIDKHNA